MRSFALWYSTSEKVADVADKEISVHVNLWDKEEKTKYCFDFGLLVEDIRGIKYIYIYLPFKIGKDQVKDLGNTISNNKLVNAIFNENFTTTDGEPKRLIVNNNDDNSKFIIYSLEVENQIELISFKRNNSTPGTILKIDFEDIEIKPAGVSRYYFRIRLEAGKGSISFINDEIKGVNIFSDQFTNTEIIDFRLNDVRSCSEELREQFNKGKQFKIKAIHYLILRNASDIIVHYGREMTSRMLEDNLWKDYIGKGKTNVIAYHIKCKADKELDMETKKYTYKYIESFSDLTRFQYQKTNFKIVFVYVLVIILIGALCGVIGNLISSYFGI